MDIERSRLKDMLFFSAQDVAAVQGISGASAHVLCSRYVQRGIFIRIKKDFYVLERKFERYGNRDFFQLSNFLQVPSYVSCMTALAFYGITTQVQRDWFENITWRRSTEMGARGVSFRFYKIQSSLYFGFVKQEGFFIAEPEKALVDAAYLNTLGRYSLDWSSLNLDAIDKEKLVKLMSLFPDRLKRRISRQCRI